MRYGDVHATWNNFKNAWIVTNGIHEISCDNNELWDTIDELDAELDELAATEESE